MPAERKLPDTATLIRLLDSGGPGGTKLTHKQVGEMFGTTRQAVSLALRGVVEPASGAREWPWDVQTRHKQGWFYRAVTFYVVAQRKERQLTKREQDHLASWMRMVAQMSERAHAELVVDYDPDTAGGWRLRGRRERDTPGWLLGSPLAQAAPSAGSSATS